MTIWFDMDGTIANLYGVDGWLESLINKDTKPYKEAKPLVNMNSLARVLNNLQKKGVKIGVISWLAKDSTEEFDERVKETKEKWLAKHLKSVKFDTIEIVKYGTNKDKVRTTKEEILFDDEENNRRNWKGIKAYNQENIINILKGLK